MRTTAGGHRVAAHTTSWRGRATLTTLFCGSLLLAGSCNDGPTDPSTSEPVLRQLGSATHYTSNGMRLGKTLIGDVNSDGRKDVVVRAGDGGFSRILIYYQKSDGRLAPPTVLPVADLETRSIAIGDLNGDGATDIAVVGQSVLPLVGYPGRLLVFYQDPVLHTFGPAQSFVVSSQGIVDVAIGDLNFDGRSDVVVSALWVVNPGQGRLSVRYQQAGGSLGPETIVDAVGVVPGELKIADLTGDNRNDIVVQSDMLTLAILPQLGDGTLSDVPATYAVQTTYWPQFYAFAVGDLNADGRNDAVVIDPGNNGFVNFFIQGTAGRLVRSTPLTLGFPPFGVEIADIDGDGRNDIVTEDVTPGSPFGTGRVYVFYQTEAHDFLPPVAYTFETQSGGGSLEVQSLAIGDVTGDGWPDAVVTWADEGLWVLPAVRR